MSADDLKSVVLKGMTHGAVDHLIKPVRIEAMKDIQQHVVQKKPNESNVSEHSGGSTEDNDNNTSLVNEENERSSKKRNIEEVDDQGDDNKEDKSSLKKPRVVWSPVLHQRFVAAVNQLGVYKAVPKKILEVMNVPGLMREQVASHLQKYRLSLKRQGNMNHPFMIGQHQNFGPLCLLNGFDLQALAVTGQLPAQSLAQLQAAGLGWPSMLPSLGQQPMLSSCVSWRSDLTGSVAVRNTTPATNSRVLPATHSVFNNFLPYPPQYSFPLASAPVPAATIATAGLVTRATTYSTSFRSSISTTTKSTTEFLGSAEKWIGLS